MFENYQQLLITKKLLKSLKKHLRLNFILFYFNSNTPTSTKLLISLYFNATYISLFQKLSVKTAFIKTKTQDNSPFNLDFRPKFYILLKYKLSCITKPTDSKLLISGILFSI